MNDVIVLGGYGQVGFACVREIVETTRVGVVVAGRSVQKAEQAALACGENARGVYANACDARTLRSLLPGAAAVVCCTGDGTVDALAVALESRVPFIEVAPVALDPDVIPELGGRAWEAQVPVILGAGAVPGIPGILAEYLVRRMPEIDELRIATTGPWRGTETARRDVDQLRRDRPGGVVPAEGGGVAARPRRWRFPEPLGSWPVRPAPAIDLEGFSRSHLVRSLAYLEVELGPLARAGIRLLRHDPAPPSFAAVAEARRADGSGEERQRVEVQAPDILRAAAAAAGVTVRAILAKGLPAGLMTQRETMSPGVFLDEFQKRELVVRTTSDPEPAP